MKVLVLGANGKVGSRVAQALLQRGHEVVAGVHKNKSHVPKGAVVVTLDITDQGSIQECLKGCDAVVCALSSWHEANHAVLGQAMRTVIPAMEQAKVRRIVSISGDVARLPGERSTLLVRLFHALAVGVIRKVVHDSEDHMRQLSESDLDWTVLRPGVMTNSPHNSYTLQHHHPASITVPRAAVVASIIHLLEHVDHVHEAPFITESSPNVA